MSREAGLDEIDRTDPGYQRHCARPDCAAAFNILDVMDGRAKATGWRLLRSVVQGYICPDHAAPVINGSHRPSWGRDPDDDVVRSIICACGWTWSPWSDIGVMVAVQHQYQDAWLAHLIALEA